MNLSEEPRHAARVRWALALTDAAIREIEGREKN
jgi:hypothetical protein